MPDKKGKFLKGEGGRRKGSVNKQTRDIKEIHGRILEVISGNITVKELVKASKPDTLINYIGRALPQNIHIDGDINLSDLSREDLERLRKDD